MVLSFDAALADARTPLRKNGAMTAP